MPTTQSLLVQFSEALSALTAQARAFTAEVHASSGETVSGVLWRPNAVVVSEQALPDGAEYEVRIGDQVTQAELAGRDEGTNVAVLKLVREIGQALPAAAAPELGALALLIGTGGDGLSARLGIVRSVGGPWQSRAGGTIDQRIIVDSFISPREEGGPVLAADGTLFGISTRGAGGQSLIIPASTVNRVAGVLLEKGSVERGWLGLSLRPVALPETLRPDQEQHVGLMVMDVAAESPAAKAGLVPSDILLAAGGTPATRFGAITRKLGPDSIGKTVEFTLARAGSILTSKATIAARRPA